MRPPRTTPASKSSRQITGRLSVHPRGFGFIAPSGDQPAGSFFVPPPDMRGLMADDRVTAEVVDGDDGRPLARRLQLVERRRVLVYGEVVERRGRLSLKVDPEIATGEWPFEGGSSRLAAGDAVIARVDGERLRVVRSLPSDADRSWHRILARHELRDGWSTAVVEELRDVTRTPHRLRDRRDLRGVPTITVDAPSTRDIDDAISALPPSRDGALRLLVSIADVAEFVPEDGALDREARARATSTYLPDGVLPMLPDELSSDHLSLLPGRDRCCLTAELRIDPEGSVLSVDVYESLIRSAGRVSYDEMARFLDDQEVVPATEAVAEALPLFRAAAARLGIARLRRGGVQFARDEARVHLDPQTGAPTELSTLRSTTAHQMIERFMVAANEAIAMWLQARGVPALYRVHEPPDAGRTESLAAIAHNFGFEAGFGGKITPLSLAVLDSQIARTPWEGLVRSVMLRALGPARYTVEPRAHFGLAAPLYLHFTSPIRRYADLKVHRAVKRYLRGERPADALDPHLRELAEHVNERASASGRAERDRTRVMQARWLADRVGSRHRARVTRVRASGLTAQLESALVEGSIALDSLPGGPYRPDAHETALVGARSRFVIGMPLTVRIRAVDPDIGRIELELDEPPRR